MQDVIAPASRELLAMCLDVVDRACGNEEIMASLGLPQTWWDALVEDRRLGSEALAMRFDLAYGGDGVPKLLECNAENPGDLHDAAQLQDQWLTCMREQGHLPLETAQFNNLQNALVSAFADMAEDPQPLYFACEDDNPEDLAELRYLETCAAKAGCLTKMVAVGGLRAGPEGGLSDASGAAVRVLVKRERWQKLLSRIPVSAFLGRSRPVVLEPFWTTLMSSKAILPWLWRFNPGHPNLLPAWFRHADDIPARLDHVVKPRISHRGHNIRIVAEHLPGGFCETPGPFADEHGILQAYHPLFRSRRSDGCDVHAVVGSWIIGGKPAGIGIFEGTHPILMGDTVHFAPHIVLSQHALVS